VTDRLSRLWRRLELARAGRGPRGSADYHGFISYSHEVDGRLAVALQSSLHRFARPVLRLRALRVFRDQASLAGDPALWPALEAALSRSRFFILLASTRAAESPWVGREVAYWRAHNSSRSVLIVLTDGEVAWDEAAGDFDWRTTTALPAGLGGAFTDAPRWVDLRWARAVEHPSLRNPQFRDAIADIAAPLHGVRKDELVGEDVRQYRRARRLARSAVATLALLLAAATVAAVLAVNARNEARREADLATSRQLAAEGPLHLSERPDRALLLAVEAYHRAHTAEAAGSLVQALVDRPYMRGFMWPRVAVTAGPAASQDGRTAVVGGSRGRLISCAILTERARSRSAPG
jgi:hypothetical protein